MLNANRVNERLLCSFLEYQFIELHFNHLLMFSDKHLPPIQHSRIMFRQNCIKDKKKPQKTSTAMAIEHCYWCYYCMYYLNSVLIFNSSLRMGVKGGASAGVFLEVQSRKELE